MLKELAGFATSFLKTTHKTCDTLATDATALRKGIKAENCNINILMKTRYTGSHVWLTDDR